ncbi:hypothetical protein [Pendulispora albinea]|uniref:Glycoside hydrolase family 42 N-terminal domain-containing protein n=1 Tax=Pendulispora albinea TaxID=2741071 RepID=A0ABZ2MBX8_9BACT
MNRSIANIFALIALAACSENASNAPPGGDADGGNADAHGGHGDARPDSGADSYGPWEDPPAYYARFPRGLPSDPSFFPIAVWLQNPDQAANYAAIGVNHFVGLWEGPTDAQLTKLAKVPMPVLCDQNGVGLAHVNDPTVHGWLHDDEPDNAQPDGRGGYGPCIAPETIVQRYEGFRKADPTHPVFLNLGQGVASPTWVGRGSCSGHDEHYPKYAEGADIVSFDVYPVNSYDGDLGLVARGVDRLRAWAKYKKPVWNWIETTGYNEPKGRPTPAQIKAEVWMSIVHGSMGIGYFVHILKPNVNERGLLDDPENKAAVSAINAQIRALAPVLNTPPVIRALDVVSSDTKVPVDTLMKRHGGATYVFAVAMKNAKTTATFTVRGVAPSAKAEVLGENRTISLANGVFQDAFDGYGVHLYKVQ